MEPPSQTKPEIRDPLEMEELRLIASACFVLNNGNAGVEVHGEALVALMNLREAGASAAVRQRSEFVLSTFDKHFRLSATEQEEGAANETESASETLR